MANRGELTHEDFLVIARRAGLDISDIAHMDQLYPYVQAVLRGLQPLHAISLDGVEPAMVYHPDKE